MDTKERESPDGSDSNRAGYTEDTKIDHAENGGIGGHVDPAAVDHRDDDDRAEEARGRNADQMDHKYWLSVNYIGTLFAVGMAFMGGIGGKSTVDTPRS